MFMGKLSKGDLWSKMASVQTNEKTKDTVDDDLGMETLPSPKIKPKGDQKVVITIEPEAPEECLIVNENEQDILPDLEQNPSLAGDGIAENCDDVPSGQLVVLNDNNDTFPLKKVERLDMDLLPHPPIDGSHSYPATIDNIEYLLKGYGITARYNLIKKAVSFFVPGLRSTSDNADNVMLAQIKSCCRLNGMSVSGLEETLLAVADRCPINPPAIWIKSRPWDGIDRSEEFFDTLTVSKNCPKWFRDILVRRWMVSATAAIFEMVGFRARGVLTLQGEQGIGKTSWFGALVPDPYLRESVLKLDYHLDAGNKDSQITATNHWIVEMSELDGSFRKDIAKIKGFISLDCDKIRVPYARSASVFPRRTVFGATVNEPQFLVDSTGNSRFWTLPVTKINYQHGLDLQQIWAQFAVEYEKGEQWWLTPEENEYLTLHNKQYQKSSVIRDLFVEAIDMDRIGEEGLKKYSSTEVLKYIGIESPKNQQNKECCAILREYLGDSTRIKGSDKWPVPFKENSINFPY